MPKTNQRSSVRKNILLLIITLLVLAIVLEGATRLLYGKNLQYVATKNTVWELKPNQQGFTIPGKPKATINSMGFRDKEPFKENSYKILVVGDSFAFGYGVGDNETLAYFLEERLNNGFGKDFELLNYGVPGYGIYQMDALARKKTPEIKPDMVILVIIKGNVLRQNDKQDSEFFIKNTARIILRKSSFAAVMKPKLEIFRSLVLGTKEERYKQFDDYWKIDSQRINSLHQELQNNNIDMVIVPYIYDASDLDFIDYLQKDLDKEILIVDGIYPALDEFSKNNNQLLHIPGDGHPTAKSYQIATDVIVEKLINKHII